MAEYDEIYEKAKDKLAGRSFTVALTGTAGAGKSGLINTMLMRMACVEGRSAYSVSTEAREVSITIPLKNDTAATVLVYDTPGFTGGRINDEMAEKALREVKEPDLLLVCFSLDSDGGRYEPFKITPTLRKLTSVFGEEKMKNKAVIVLTKCNLACEQRKAELAARVRPTLAWLQDDEPAFIDTEVENWKTAHRNEQQGDVSEYLPILIAGRLNFDRQTKKAVSFTEVDGSTKWVDDLWRGVCTHTHEDLATLGFVIKESAKRDPTTTDSVRSTLGMKLDYDVLKKVAVFSLGSVALGLTGGLGIVAIGATGVMGSAAAGVAAVGALGGAAAAAFDSSTSSTSFARQTPDQVDAGTLACTQIDSLPKGDNKDKSHESEIAASWTERLTSWMPSWSGTAKKTTDAGDKS